MKKPKHAARSKSKSVALATSTLVHVQGGNLTPDKVEAGSENVSRVKTESASDPATATTP